MGDELSGRLREVYRDLHAHPELSFEEHRTAGIAAGWLRDLDFEVIEGIARTGVAGVLRNGDGPAVLLRADMGASSRQDIARIVGRLPSNHAPLYAAAREWLAGRPG
jgi:metal-dependent amidase/aminoacylase/carboxypeptidase family protein